MRVIVVGGGVIGCAAAWSLARSGHSVTLLERDGIGAHASGAAAGMLAPLCESPGEGPFFELGMRSLSLFPEFVSALREESGIDPQLVRSGILRLAVGEGETRELQERAARLEAHGVRWLEPAEARRREPLVRSDTGGGLWSPEEGHVSGSRLARACAAAAARRGARVECGVPVTGLLREGERVCGVRTAEGVVEGEQVVLCAGAWAGFCSAWVDRPLPVQPVRGQILALESPGPAPRSILWGAECYLVPKPDGTLVVGATEEHAGFDCRPTAAGVARLLAAAVSLAPAVADCTFRRAWAGLRPGSPDCLPVLGPLPGVEGLTVAAGHYRNGVLLSAVTAELVARWAAGDQVELAPELRAGRFVPLLSGAGVAAIAGEPVRYCPSRER